MHADWNESSNGLPRDGQQIEFVLDYRSVALEGTYVHQTFRSHWAEYSVDRVRSWRKLALECDRVAPARNQAERVLSSAPRYDTSLDLLPAGGMIHAA